MDIAPLSCHNCHYLAKRLRSDFMALPDCGVDYFCEAPAPLEGVAAFRVDEERWLGFQPIRPEWCPLTPEELDAMAKKKAAKTATKRARKGSTPLPGQKALDGVEDDRDLELDRAMEAVVKARTEKKTKQAQQDAAEEKVAELLRQKERTSYSGAGLTAVLSKEENVKIKKASRNN